MLLNNKSILQFQNRYGIFRTDSGLKNIKAVNDFYISCCVPRPYEIYSSYPIDPEVVECNAYVTAVDEVNNEQVAQACVLAKTLRSVNANAFLVCIYRKTLDADRTLSHEDTWA